MPATNDPRRVVQSIGRELKSTLAERLLGLYLHGSLVSGDFSPERSDLDLMAVLTEDPDDEVLRRLVDVHRRVAEANEPWRGRVEVEYVGLGALEDAALGKRTAHTIARISPGEAMHLLGASPHRLLGWNAARVYGEMVCGPAAAALIPAVDPAAVREAALDHVRDWPVWVRDMHPVGGQVYAVLSVCRAYCLFVVGAQYSKKRAAVEVAALAPAWSELVTWARRWWYAGGSAEDPGCPAQVVAFVDEVCARILVVEAGRGQPG